MRRWSVRTALFGLLLAAMGCGGADYLATCATNLDCFDGYACAAETPGSSVDICLRACTAQGGCLDSEYCDIPAGEASGVCRFGDAP